MGPGDAALARSAAISLVRSQLLGEAVTGGGYLVLVADEFMRIAAASDAVCTLLGWSADEITKLRVPDIVADPSDGERRYHEFLSAGSQRGSIGLRCRSGRIVPATYEAHQTRMAGLPYYVSVLFPTR